MKFLAIIFAIVFNLSFCLGQKLTADVEFTAGKSLSNEVVVSVTIKKENIDGYIKFVQNFPENFTVKKIETIGGNFLVTDSILKIIWLIPPVEDTFVLKYSLLGPETEEVMEYNFEAYFEYLINTNTERYSLKASTFKTKQENTEVKSSEKTTYKSTTITSEKDNSGPINPKATTITPTATNALTTTTTTTNSTSSNLIYSVQIGAFTSSPNISGVEQMFTVKMENGVTKYLSGTFKTRAEADAHKQKMLSQGFSGAFIVIFKDGKILK
jgi:hypothetical protein